MKQRNEFLAVHLFLLMFQSCNYVMTVIKKDSLKTCLGLYTYNSGSNPAK